MGGPKVLLSLIVLSIASSCDDGIGPRLKGDLVLWSVPSGSAEGTPHSPVANGDRSMVYFVTPTYRLKKIRGSDGQVMFDVSAGPPVVTFPQYNAVLSADIVAITKVDIVAFDTATGAPRWTYAPTDLEETGHSPIVANETTIFAAGYRGRMHAIDASTGVARWVTDLREGASDVGALNPSLDGNIVYVCTKNFQDPPFRGTLWALDAETGTVRWSHRFVPELAQQYSACFGSPAVWQDLVIQPQEDGRVFAFERATGQVRWTAPRVHDVNRSANDRRWAAAGGSYVLVTSQANEGMITAYDAATGAEVWRHTANSGSLYPPVLDDSTAYVDHGWTFASYRITTGQVRWQTPESVRSGPETMYKGRPVISGDRIYVSGRDASYALRR